MPLHTPQDIARMYGVRAHAIVWSDFPPSMLSQMARDQMTEKPAKPPKKPKPSKGGKKGSC